MFLCQGESKNTITRDIDDQDIKYVFLGKGTWVLYSNINSNHIKAFT